MTRRATVVTVLLLGLSTLHPMAQQVSQGPPIDTRQQPSLTFRAATNIVEVDAIVTDAAGAFVRNLERGDFEVIEDGKPQTLALSSLIDIPITRPDPPLYRGTRVIEPDVMSNEKPFEGRVFMIVLDSLHVATIRSTQVKTQARKFIDNYLGANDLAAVIHIGHPAAGQEFTSNKRLLLASIDKFVGRALNSATYNLARDARFKQAQLTDGSGSPSGRPIDPGPPEDPEARERAYMARESANQLTRASEYMSGLIGRRKALMLFSEGMDFATLSGPVMQSTGPLAPVVVDESDSVRLSQREMIAAASRANVSIYSIDPRGLATGGEDMVAVGAVAQMDDGTAPNGRDYSNPLMRADMGNEIKIAQDSLRSFSNETGGIAFVDHNDSDVAFRRVVEDNSAYYLLGYTSPDRRRDGRFHRVEVRLKRPGLKVRTRNGYYAPNEKEVTRAQIDPVRELLSSPAPLTGLRMRANAGVVRSPEGPARVHLTVEFNGTDVSFKPQSGLFMNDIEVGVMAMDMMGKAAASSRQFMHLRLRDATYKTFPQTGVRYVTEFDLPPGRYQLRLAAREDVGGKTGSIFYDLEVPDFAKVPLSMSDLLITSTSTEKTPTGKGAPSLGAKLPGQTTAARMFSSSETLSVFAGVYDADPGRSHSIDFKVVVTSDDGREVIKREDARNSDELGGTKGEFPYTLSVPLQSLTPGRYVLSVEARSRLGGEPARKDVEFRIR